MVWNFPSVRPSVSLPTSLCPSDIFDTLRPMIYNIADASWGTGTSGSKLRSMKLRSGILWPYLRLSCSDHILCIKDHCTWSIDVSLGKSRSL